jgi:hypothetical protein
MARGNLYIVDYVWPNAVGNKTNLVGLIGELFASEFPAHIMGLQCHWMGSFQDAQAGSEHEILLEIVSQDGNRTSLLGLKTRVVDPGQTVAFHSPLPPVPLASPGWVAFVLSVGGVEVSRVDLPAVKRGAS